MALLHYLARNGARFGISVSALNCDHGMRGEQSASDSRFVARWCKENDIPLTFFKAEGFSSEAAARAWRLECYIKMSPFVDCVATAHHLGDNAETVLFNLARGSSLSGMAGITDEDMSSAAGRPLRLIRPMICCTRKEIEEYIAANGIPYVDDCTNFSDDYTRNKIRHNVLPALEEAVPGAAAAIYRFSRLAAEDEEYFVKLAAPLVKSSVCGYTISYCSEKSVFTRAAYDVVSKRFARKDYTSSHFDSLFSLQFSENGKKFSFLNLTAYKEEGVLRIVENSKIATEPLPFSLFEEGKVAFFGGVELTVSHGAQKSADGKKVLRADGGKIPSDAVVRTMCAGDKFKKFGGGTKSLGDFFTDRKIPAALRDKIPLVASGNEILVVCGVEISDKVKVCGDQSGTLYITCAAFGADN